MNVDISFAVLVKHSECINEIEISSESQLCFDLLYVLLASELSFQEIHKSIFILNLDSLAHNLRTLSLCRRLEQIHRR